MSLSSSQDSGSTCDGSVPVVVVPASASTLGTLIDPRSLSTGSRETMMQLLDNRVVALKSQIIATYYDRNRLARINSLPDEVLFHIFGYLVPPYSEERSYRASYSDRAGRSWYWFSHVCQVWRAIALTCPSLWTHLELKNSSLTQAMLERSKQLPLTIDINHPYDYLLKTLAVQLKSASENTARIGSLKVSGVSAPLGEWISLSTQPAPVLSNLEINAIRTDRSVRWLEIPDTLFQGSAPNLRRLRIGGSGISWTCPLLRDLTFLEIISSDDLVRSPSTVMDMLDVWERLPTLQTLRLKYALPPKAALFQGLRRTISFPQLKILEVTDSAESICGPLLGMLTLPFDVKLKLSVETELSITPVGNVAEPEQMFFSAISEHLCCRFPSESFRGMSWDSSDGLRICAWTQQGPSPDLELHFPIPDEWSESSALRKAFMDRSWLDDVKRLRLGGLARKAMPELLASLQDDFGEIEELQISDNVFRDFSVAFLDNAKDAAYTQPLLFPALEVITLYASDGWDRDSTKKAATALVRALGHRKQLAASLSLLRVQRPNEGEFDIARLHRLRCTLEDCGRFLPDLVVSSPSRWSGI